MDLDNNANILLIINQRGRSVRRCVLSLGQGWQGLGVRLGVGDNIITNILYSQNQYKCMLDIYLVLLPTYAIITIINLYYLKQSLKDNAIAVEIAYRNIGQAKEVQNQEESELKRCIRHLLRNFTLLQFCAVGRGKYKLSLLLTVSLVSIATFYISSPFSFAYLGVVVYSVYFLVAMAAVSRQQNEEDKTHKQKYLQLIYAISSIVVNFTLIVLLYKNYRNSLLKQFVANCAINLAIDNFAVRPLAVIILSFPLSRSNKVMEYIKHSEMEVSLIELYEKCNGKQMLQKPIGKMYSPSKIPKCVPLNMEIEPIPLHQVQEQSNSARWFRSLVALKQSASEDKLEKSLYILQQILSESSREKSFNLLKKITREDSIEKCLSILTTMVREEREQKLGHYLHHLKKNLTPLKQTHRLDDHSMNSLFNSTNKDQQTPRARHVQLDESLHTSEHQIEFNNQVLIQNKPNTIETDQPMPKFGSDNMVMINPSRQEPLENEEDEATQPQERKITEGSIEEEQLNFNKKETIDLRDEINPLKITIHQSSGPSSRNEPLRICLNGEENRYNEEEEDEDVVSDRYRKRRSTINVEETSAKNTIGAMEVKLSNRNQCEEIEQIDLNSPERRRKMGMKDQEVSRIEVLKKKNKKRLSIDERQRVIRFTTGEPYLEYLPNMLSKDKKKKSQQFNAKKELVIDSRMANSSKKQKNKKEINFQNNQNMVPSFRIQQV